MNRMTLIGRITKDLELKETTETKRKYTKFDVAINNGKDKNGNERAATFINCATWDKRAETLVQYLHKGDRIYIEGEYKIDKYQKQNGENRYIHYILVNDFEFLENKPKENYEPSEPDYIPVPEAPIPSTEVSEDPFQNFGEEITLSDDDLPF